MKDIELESRVWREQRSNFFQAFGKRRWRQQRVIALTQFVLIHFEAQGKQVNCNGVTKSGGQIV
jgi:hypothetical protein